MQINKSLASWIDALAALAGETYSAWQSRKSVLVMQRDGGFLLRRSDAKGDAIGGDIAVGAALSRETAEMLAGRLVLFELPEENIVTRRLSVPARAQEFLPGIIGNQIDRLSPWPVAQAVYGFEAEPGREDADMLDVRVMIVARSKIATICDELKAHGLAPDRIVAPQTSQSKSAPVVLWQRLAQPAQPWLRNLPQTIGTALLALVIASAALNAWALFSANSAWQDYEDAAARVDDLKRYDQMAKHPQSLALRDPAERAWAMKANSPTAVLTLEALARALPQTAYLTELRLDNKTLRITGLAIDPPPLIAALERSKRFFSVHFFAPTTKETGAERYRFSIEAQVQDHFEPIGD